MKRLFTLISTVLLLVTAGFSADDVCSDMKDDAKKLYNKCKAMNKKSGEYEQCKSAYKLLTRKVKTACQGGQSETALQKNINQWQELVDRCKGRQSSRCSKALHALGSFTYKLEELQYLKETAGFEEFVEWCADRDNKPSKCKGGNLLPPKADHTKSLSHFMDFIKKYSKDAKMPLILYQAAAVFESMQEDEKAYKLRLKLVQGWPNDGLVPKAWLRIGEYFFLNRKFRDAIKAYQKVAGFDALVGKEAALAMYHLAEAYYNIAEYEMAATKYFDYIVGADKGRYPADLRTEAMDFMAASFADMDDGVDVASKFMKDKRVAFRDSLYFRMGMKNKDHDRNEEAVECFNYLLDINPDYIDAPLADLAMVEILIKQQKYDEAQSQRYKVVKRYDKKSSWYRKNQQYPKSVENAEGAIRASMLDIPQYHHAIAAKHQKAGDLRPAKEEYQKAIKGYEAFLIRYKKEPTWDEYKVHINLALVYQEMEVYAKSAEQFNWIDDTDTTRFGRRKIEDNKLLKKEEAAYNAVLMMDKNREIAVAKKAGGDETKGYKLSETKAYFKQVDRYMKKWGKTKDAPSLAYNAALIHYNAKEYKIATDVLLKLRKDFPKHEHTLLISRMLAQSYLEAGRLDEAEKEFSWLHKQYKGKTNRNDSLASEIDKSIAAVLFQKADKSVKGGKNEKGAKAFLALVNRYPTADFADKAVFEAAVAYENAKMYKAAAETFMLMPRRYAKSPLTVKAILRAANAYKKNNQPKDAARTFLFITDNFPKDSMAFNAIAWAAAVYDSAAITSKNADDSASYKKMSAQTFELAFKKYPKHEKTPSLLYSACLSYEEAKVTEEAIRCNRDLVREYPKSSYALDAAYSIPIAYQKAKKWDIAAEEFKKFAKMYTSDKEKLIAAYYGAAKAYVELKDDKNAAEEFKNVIATYDKHGLQIANADPAIPAEAAFYLGEIQFKEMEKIELKGNDKAKAKLLKALVAELGKTMSHYAKSAEYASEKWTFKSTNKMGMLFVTVAAKIREQEIQAKNDEERFVKRITVVQQLPSYYEQARPIFEKNIMLAREQGFYNQDVIAAEEGYVEMFYQDCATFFEVASAFRGAPLPNRDAIIREYVEYEGMAKPDAEMAADEDLQAYKDELENKASTAEQGGVPKCATGIKAAAHYQIENKWTEKLFENIRMADSANEVLQTKIVKFDPSSLFRDTKYFKTKARIEQIAKSKVMSPAEQIKTFQEIIKAAQEENSKLKSEWISLKRRLDALNAPKPAATGGAAAATGGESADAQATDAP